MQFPDPFFTKSDAWQSSQIQSPGLLQFNRQISEDTLQVCGKKALSCHDKHLNDIPVFVIIYIKQ